MSTAPWSPAAAALLSESHGQGLRAVATHPDFDGPVQLDLVDCQVSFDERRAPRVQASLTVGLADTSLVPLLDPRMGVRVEISAGYRLPGGDEDIQLLADLGLRLAVPDYGDRTLSLALSGDEALVVDASPAVSASASAASHSGAALALIKQAISPAPKFVATISGAAVTVDPVPDRWAAVQDLADRVGAAVFDDGLRVWHFDPVPSLAGAPVLSLTVGAGGTVLAGKVPLDRDAWNNYVCLRYKWRDASNVDQEIRATAVIDVGPYAITGPAGKKILLDDREVATTQAAANTAAASVLIRQFSRSQSTILRAISAYWLRPGHTIDVRLTLTGDAVRQLVSAVTFNQDGTMEITTRLPDAKALPTTAPISTTTPPSAPRVPDPAPPATDTYVTTWTGNGTRTFKQDGTENTFAGGDAIQGYYDSTNGNQQAVILFTAANSTGDETSVTITSAIAGAKISKVEVRLFANHWWSKAGGLARIGYFVGTSLPATFTSAVPRVTRRFARNQGQWVNVTSNALIAALKDGSSRGITVGPGVGADRQYYGQFNGSGASTDKPLIRLTYSK